MHKYIYTHTYLKTHFGHLHTQKQFRHRVSEQHFSYKSLLMWGYPNINHFTLNSFLTKINSKKSIISKLIFPTAQPKLSISLNSDHVHSLYLFHLSVLVHVDNSVWEIRQSYSLFPILLTNYISYISMFHSHTQLIVSLIHQFFQSNIEKAMFQI